MTWVAQCILCAARGRLTRLESGHVCAPCEQRILDEVRAIADLAAMASAYLTPGSSTAGGTGAYGSRPPLNVQALDPELALVRLVVDDPSTEVTILEMVEAWERVIRQDRGLAPYGPVSHARATQYDGVLTATHCCLVGTVRFLASQVPWMCATADFGIEDFADQVHRSVRVLRRWDMDAEAMGTEVKCPTLTDQGECGYALHYRAADEHVTCRRCGASRDVTTLIAVAMSDGRPVWMDPENAAKWLGVNERRLRRMATRNEIERSHGRYLIRHAG